LTGGSISIAVAGAPRRAPAFIPDGSIAARNIRLGAGRVPPRPPEPAMSAESDDHPDILAFPPAIAGGVVIAGGLLQWLRPAWLVCGLPVTAALLHFGVIVPEERYLDAKFGDIYRAYRARVRRYL